MMSAFEQARGFTLSLIAENLIYFILNEIIQSQQDLQALRKLNSILRSKFPT